MEHDEKAERLEHEVEQLEEQSERVGEHIRETREDWERKEEDPSVPGAQPDPDEESEEESDVTETPPRSRTSCPRRPPPSRCRMTAADRRDEDGGRPRHARRRGHRHRQPRLPPAPTSPAEND